MSHIVVLGAGIGGMSAAYELRALLGSGPAITVIGEGALFSFTPSNPWVAVGWRKPVDVQIPVHGYLAKKKIAFEGAGAERIVPGSNRVLLRDGRHVDYDFLVIATGPRLAFDEVAGLGPDAGFTQSICTTPHATSAWQSTAPWASCRCSTECAGARAARIRICGSERRCAFKERAGDGRSSATTLPCPSTWMGATAQRWTSSHSVVPKSQSSRLVTIQISSSSQAST